MGPKHKSKKSEAPQKPHVVAAPGKSVPHGEEFDAPFVGPAESSSSAVDANAENIIALVNRVSELESDLVRIVDLIVKGDIDSVKFKEILSKRQGKA